MNAQLNCRRLGAAAAPNVCTFPVTVCQLTINFADNTTAGPKDRDPPRLSSRNFLSFCVDLR